jgi:hypothetical protein
MLKELPLSELGEMLISPDTRHYAVAGGVVVLGFAFLLKRYLTGASGSNLRTFKVTGNNVVEVLEEAHKEVCLFISTQKKYAFHNY